MTGILIATHGGLAEGLLNAIELLAGKQEKIETIGLYHGDGIDAFAQEVEKTYEKLNGEDGVLVFVDILGGSPSNAVMKLMNEKDNVKAIAGVNWCAPRQVDSEKNISFSASWFYQLAVFLCCL
ncbi:PTS sugar transporter subunit IIA [Anaerostipes sp.]|uniref:PTS sugar transporter subunit IIA n=1 Tax=Anaerostipes sp. TaxID=1872530 RepID=UPI00258028FF|nr:PTS sugar transporter subunit IIA [Anaerostipes sp.]